MTLNSEDSTIRNLARYHYFRNRHLTSAQDADDLFQDAWIQLNHPPPANARATGEDDEEPLDIRMKKAVRRATDRAFGKLRKRCSRGAPSETVMEFEPADCCPDPDLIIDLRNEIESLPLDERLVIEFLRLGYDGKEIAKQLELSPQAVTRRKQKAISRLREKLGA